MKYIYNETNFFHSTFADFQKLAKEEIPKGKPDFVSDSGSKYWYLKDGVIRYSNHWLRQVASCKWFLNGKNYGTAYGYCEWKDFLPINHYNLTPNQKYKVYKAPYDRQGQTTYIEEMTGVFIKKTEYYFIFDKFKVASKTMITAIEI